MAQASEKLNTPKLVTAHARNLRIAPRKVRLVTNLVKGMQVGNAITQLQFTNKKAAPMVAKLLKSAVANAEHNFSLKADDLFIKSITCDMGPAMKRYFPRARGSAFVIRRKTSHVHVVLEDRPGKGPKKKAVPAAKAATAESKDDKKQAKKDVAPEVAKPVVADQAKPAAASKTATAPTERHEQAK